MMEPIGPCSSVHMWTDEEVITGAAARPASGGFRAGSAASGARPGTRQRAAGRSLAVAGTRPASAHKGSAALAAAG
jgi:hypothetical protein